MRLIWIAVVGVILALTATACGGDDRARAAEPAATADEVVERISNGLADGHPEVLWHALPESYQRDVTELVHEAAGKMDGELWNRSFSVVRKLSRVLTEKREFIVEHPMIAGQVEGDTEEGWDALAEMVDVIAGSDLADLEKVKTLDVERFLAETGGDLMESLSEASALTPEDSYNKAMKDLGATKATIVSSSGESAVVKVEMPNQPVKEEEYVRVEGKWLPKTMVDEWPAKMAEMKASVAAFSGEEMQENKQTVLMQLSMVEGALDQLLAAQTAEEFNAGAGAMMGLAMGAMMSQAGEGGVGSGMTSSIGPGSGAQVQITPDDGSSYPGSPLKEPTHKINLDQSPAIESGDDPAIAGVRERAAAERDSGRVAEWHPFGADQPIPLAEAENFVGQYVWAERKDGTDVRGRLVAVTDSDLTLEREFGGGTVMFDLARDDIGRLQVEK
jgi:hypothetical protein